MSHLEETIELKIQQLRERLEQQEAQLDAKTNEWHEWEHKLTQLHSEQRTQQSNYVEGESGGGEGEEEEEERNKAQIWQEIRSLRKQETLLKKQHEDMVKFLADYQLT